MLAARGVPVELVTEERALRYGDAFPARATHMIPSATPRGGSPVERVRALARLGQGLFASVALLRRLQPGVVIGFGGYPTVPPLLAASLLKIPTIIHEANGVMGKANRFLAPRASAIAVGFPLDGAPAAWREKIVLTGNPLRPKALAATHLPYPQEGALRLLVTGGSQGARIMADVVPPAIASLPEATRARLLVTQQTRAEDLARVSETYARAGVDAELAPFFDDLPARIAASHLVIARSGASTVSELAAIGRAAILVPLPHALDQDQAANAAVLSRAGGAEIVRQEAFTPAFLASRLAQLVESPGELRRAAQKAKSVGVVDAAERLADLAQQVGGV
ncbi:UDP-N-acetylglucosamine--N-acetylmuramyl-(pentapeptide) pyrophosphoryl-undecaprenol N-acetylglucosamine transferase [Methylocystis bryophila]|nr:UDP-N-acetylglucosamine--N-acetylmuramyl-(pentapeptide) pyrophosphoryl-undecaprenol N-acetylglucosamine transferase [Methylocystis bryophila]